MKEVNLKVNVEGGKEVDKLNDGLEETNDLTQEAGAQFGVLGQMMGKLKAGFKVIKSGFASMKVGIASTGIGLLLVAFGALTAFFTKTKRGADILAKATAVLGVVMGKLTDIVAKLGEGLFDAFNDPQQALKDFGEGLKTFVMNRVEDLISGVKGLGKAFMLLFEGEFKEAMSVAAVAVGDLVTATNPLAGLIKDNADALADMSDEMKAAAVQAGILADAQAKLADQNIRDLTIRAKLRKEIAQARLDAKEDGKTDAEKIASLELAIQKEEQLLAIELKAAKAKARLLKEEQKLTENLREDEEELAQLEADVIDLETKSLLKKKALASELAGLKKKARATEKKAEDKERKDREADEKKHQDKLNKIIAEAKKIVDEITEKTLKDEKQAIRDDYAAKLKLIIVSEEYNAEEILKHKKALKKKEDEELADIDERERLRKEKLADQEKKERQQIEDDYRQAAKDTMMILEELLDESIERRNKKIQDEYDRKQKMLETKHDNEISSLEARAAKELEINGEVSEKTQKAIVKANDDKLMAQYQLDLALFKQQEAADKEANKQKKRVFKVNQALALAQGIINTALAITSALTTVPYPLGVAAAVAAGAAGTLQTVMIARQKFSPSNTSGTAPKPPSLSSFVSTPADLGGGSPSPTDTAFNRQELASVGPESVGGGAGERQQIKVTVLESDISETQANVNTIVETAEFGG